MGNSFSNLFHDFTISTYSLISLFLQSKFITIFIKNFHQFILYKTFSKILRIYQLIKQKQIYHWNWNQDAWIPRRKAKDPKDLFAQKVVLLGEK